MRRRDARHERAERLLSDQQVGRCQDLNPSVEVGLVTQVARVDERRHARVGGGEPAAGDTGCRCVLDCACV